MAARDIDELILLLDRQIAAYLDRRSPLAYFPALYRAVTIRVRQGIELGAFEDENLPSGLREQSGRDQPVDTAAHNDDVDGIHAAPSTTTVVRELRPNLERSQHQANDERRRQ